MKYRNLRDNLLRLGAGLAAVAFGLSGCAELDGTSGSDEGPALESLVSIAQAVGPEDGDFSDCRQTLFVDDFDPVPPTMEIVNGRLQLRQESEGRPDLWIANASANTVTRINTETYSVVGTYNTGRSPSRTAVSLDFDVAIADRAFGATGTTTMIDGDCFCPDPLVACNGCRMWQTSLGNNVVPRGIAFDRNGDIWVGLYNSQRLVRLDAATGAVLSTHYLGSRIYGIAIDGAGLIWTASLYTQRINDTNRYTGELTCFDPETNAICGSFQWPRLNNLPHPLYGIAVDAVGNVWTGSWDSRRLLFMDRASFDAQRAAGVAVADLNPTMRIFTPPGSPGNTRGVAADTAGNVWVADSGRDRIYRFNSALAAFDMSVPVCDGPIGVGLSDSLDIWTMCQNADRAHAYDPELYDPTNVLAYRVASLPTGDGPYSYSDFTGFALRNFTAPNGEWRKVFECGTEGCSFNWIDWDAIVPDGTDFLVQYRTSLDGVTWSPISDAYDLEPSNVPIVTPAPRYVELILTLASNDEGETPQVGSVALWQCPSMTAPANPLLDARLTIDPSEPDYGVRWSFTDTSWPEQRFEAVDPTGLIRCVVSSTTTFQNGDRYAGESGPTPGCTETGWPSNTRLERAFRAARRLADGSWEYSPLSPTIAAYTSVNDPIVDVDLQVLTFGRDEVVLGWRRPLNSWNEAETGATLEISTTPDFNPADPGYQLLADPDDGQRGYATTVSAFGSRTFGGLEPATTYYVRLVYQNGDAVPSAPAVMSFTTWGGQCCYLGICVGVCIYGELGSDGCEEPEGYENPEVSCDGLDNDCDGEIDEGLTNACGFCGPLDPEVCDGIDNDCDGGIDNDPIDGTLYFRDADGDTWGDPAVTIHACAAPPGYVTRGRDCDDTNPDIHPELPDLCNFIDDDCDGSVDEDEPPTNYYPDNDGDSYGAGTARLLCGPTAGYAPNNTDCDDTRANVNPGHPEVCDLIDNDCDVIIDEGFLNVDVEVGAVTPLDQVPGGTTACSNGFTGRVCASNYAVEVTVTNRGTIPVPSTSSVTMFNEDGDVIGGPMNLGATIAVSGAITRTYCFGPYTAPEPEDLTVGVTGTATNSCQTFDGTAADVDFSDGLEVCDGRDNDCDNQTDESPEACGVVLECLRTVSGTFECVGALERD
jgi:streptogramin lyase